MCPGREPLALREDLPPSPQKTDGEMPFNRGTGHEC